ncbi:MAG: M20 family metallo-hydrolase [Candidatus Micrarchaeia archaeon]
MNEIEKKVVEKIEEEKEELVNDLIQILRIPAISPEYGGEGEYRKAQKILEVLKKYGFNSIKVMNAKDKRAYMQKRPNLIATINGKSNRKFWIMAHMDVVPPGDEKEWNFKPFEAFLKNGKIFGRGSLDNGQGIASVLLASKALVELGLKPRSNVFVAFLSDEECGSEYGLKFLIKKHRNLFSKRDFALIPDAGNKDGTMIEIAEKSILWLRIKVKGKQAHASTPEEGINAHRVAMQYSLALYELLHKKYKRIQYPFTNASTFEPTMVKNSASSPNIIPGEHEIVFDCRVIPSYRLESVLKDFERIAKAFEKKEKVKIAFEKIAFEKASKPTKENAKIVKELKRAIKEIKRKKAFVKGIGGGTFAKYLRELGIQSAVWCTDNGSEHRVNEYCNLKDLVEDAKVMALLMLRL